MSTKRGQNLRDICNAVANEHTGHDLKCRPKASAKPRPKAQVDPIPWSVVTQVIAALVEHKGGIGATVLAVTSGGKQTTVLIADKLPNKALYIQIRPFPRGATIQPPMFR